MDTTLTLAGCYDVVQYSLLRKWRQSTLPRKELCSAWFGWKQITNKYVLSAEVFFKLTKVLLFKNFENTSYSLCIKHSSRHCFNRVKCLKPRYPYIFMKWKDTYRCVRKQMGHKQLRAFYCTTRSLRIKHIYMSCKRNRIYPLIKGVSLKFIKFSFFKFLPAWVKKIHFCL